MGAAICSLVASLTSPRVISCTAIEALGPVAFPESAFQTAKTHISERAKMAQTPSKLTRFASIEEAISVRIKTGLHYISEPGTRLLVRRGVVYDNGEYVWSSDPVAAKSNPIRYSESDVYSFLEKIECPVLVVYGDRGLWPWYKKQGLADRTNYVKNLTLSRVPGGHHPHLEASTVDAVVDAFLKFEANVHMTSKL